MAGFPFAVPRPLPDPCRGRCVPRVFLVGAGPGDPELLTLKAARLLWSADVVLHDRLVSPGVLALARPQARLEYVGKRCGDHHVTQRETERRLIAHARAGLTVVRLKGGDPFVFGRGGEELQALAAAGVEVEMVPGITAGIGCSAYAGIPLTHRDDAQACVFVTGHGRSDASVDWSAYARRDCTLVVYMGLAGLAGMCDGLRRHGLPADWPVALVEHGTTAQQRVLTGTLRTIAARAELAAVGSPALAIIGQVVRRRPSGHAAQESGRRSAIPVESLRRNHP